MRRIFNFDNDAVKGWQFKLFSVWYHPYRCYKQYGITICNLDIGVEFREDTR